MTAATARLEGMSIDLFSEEFENDTHYTNQISSIKTNAIEKGRKILKDISQGQLPNYIEVEDLSYEDADGKYQNKTTYIDSKVAEDPKRAAYVIIHENVAHGILSDYDTENWEHPEKYAHELTGFVLENLMTDSDPQIAHLARQGYVEHGIRDIGEDMNGNPRYLEGRGPDNKAIEPEKWLANIFKWLVGGSTNSWFGSKVDYEKGVSDKYKGVTGHLKDWADRRESRRKDSEKERKAADRVARMERNIVAKAMKPALDIAIGYALNDYKTDMESTTNAREKKEAFEKYRDALWEVHRLYRFDV